MINLGVGVQINSVIITPMPTNLLYPRTMTASCSAGVKSSQPLLRPSGHESFYPRASPGKIPTWADTHLENEGYWGSHFFFPRIYEFSFHYLVLCIVCLRKKSKSYGKIEIPFIKICSCFEYIYVNTKVQTVRVCKLVVPVCKLVVLTRIIESETSLQSRTKKF